MSYTAWFQWPAALVRSVAYPLWRTTFENDSIPTKAAFNRYPFGSGLQFTLWLDRVAGRYRGLQPAFGIDR
ncbi:hypothetical protein D9M69_585880 [compost metagenome]